MFEDVNDIIIIVKTDIFELINLCFVFFVRAAMP